MSNCTIKLDLFTKHKELIEKRKEIKEKRKELQDLLLKQTITPILEDLESTKSTLTNIIISLEKINNKKVATTIKFQEEYKKMYDEQNILTLPQKNHNDLMNIIQSKTEIENFITNLQKTDNYEISEFTILQSDKIINSRRIQVAKNIQTFRIMEGLYNNIINLKNKDKNTLKQSVNDSDLGCYPYENSFNGSVVASSFKAL